MLRLACVVALLGLASPVHAWCQLTTDNTDARPGECITEGEPLRWERPCLSYTLHVDGSSDLPIDTVRTVARDAFDEWTGVSCDGEPLGLRAQETPEPTTCRNAEHLLGGPSANVIAFTDDWPDMYPEDAFAITAVWHRPGSGEIIGGDILFNERMGPFAICPDDGCEADAEGTVAADLPNVLTHEVGHLLGLAHSQFGWAAMGPSSSRGETRKRTAWSDDVVGICAMYPPGSLPAECTFEPTGGLATECTDDGCSAAPSGTGAPLWLALLALARRRRRK